jgi:hypothetical protein
MAAFGEASRGRRMICALHRTLLIRSSRRKGGRAVHAFICNSIGATSLIPLASHFFRGGTIRKTMHWVPKALAIAAMAGLLASSAPSKFARQRSVVIIHSVPVIDPFYPYPYAYPYAYPPNDSRSSRSCNRQLELAATSRAAASPFIDARTFVADSASPWSAGALVRFGQVELRRGGRSR